MEDQIAGIANQGIGRAQAAMGELNGSAKTKVKGKLKQAAGSAQQAYGELTDGVRDVVGEATVVVRDTFDEQLDQLQSYVKQKPLAAVAIAAGAGLVLGMLMRGGKTVYLRDAR